MHKDINAPETTVEELRTIGRDYYGLAWRANTRKEVIVSDIAAAMQEDERLRDRKEGLKRAAAAENAAAVAEQAAEPRRPNQPDSKKEGYSWRADPAPQVPKEDWPVIRLSKTERDVRPLPVSVNGVQYTVPRGVDVQVPPWVVHVLENAREEKYNEEGISLGEMPAHSFQVVKPASGLAV